MELGPGDGRKMKALVEGTAEPLNAHLVYVSAGALERAAYTLSDAVNLRVVTHQAPFEDGLDAITSSSGATTCPSSQRPASTP